MVNNINDHILDTASPITYGASLVTIVSGLTINEWGVVAGIVLGVATFGINWWYKHKTLKVLIKDNK